MTLSAIHNQNTQARASRNVVCDIGGIWLCQLFTTEIRALTLICRCLWYRGDMTLSAIHNAKGVTPRRVDVVCDIGGIWLCQLFTTRLLVYCLTVRCLWYRGDMTLSAIHNLERAVAGFVSVVCDIGGIWLCQLFTTSKEVLKAAGRLFVI